MRLGLLLVLMTALYVRPWELAEGYEETRAYEAIILTCLACSAVPVVRQLAPGPLATRPLTFCVAAFPVAVAFSLLGDGNQGDLVRWFLTVVKLGLLYLLVVANLDTPRRVRLFSAGLGVVILTMSALALLQYHGVINVAALAVHQHAEYDGETGGLARTYGRLCGPGIFHDPNDLCVSLVVGALLWLYWAGDRRLGPVRYLALGPVGLFLYAVTLTHSRGGLIALASGLAALGIARFGWKRAAALGALLVPATLIAFEGRQTSFDLDNREDTSQTRLRIWSDGLVLLRGAPLFGIGQGRFEDAVGIAAHNTYLEVYTQTGVVGGSLFVGAIIYGFWGLSRLSGRPPRDPDLARLRPFVLAILATMCGGMLSVSRDVTPPTFVVLGFVAAYLAVGSASARTRLPVLTPGLVGRMVVVSCAVILLIHLFTVLVVRR
jgi:putative inorganic carbon (hco3(-)) transporter